MNCTRDALLAEAEVSCDDLTSNLTILYKASVILRNIMLQTNTWSFKGSLSHTDNDVLPNETITIFKWCIQGQRDKSPICHKSVEVDTRAKLLTQTLMSACLTQRQVQNTAAISRHH